LFRTDDRHTPFLQHPEQNRIFDKSGKPTVRSYISSILFCLFHSVSARSENNKNASASMTEAFMLFSWFYFYLNYISAKRCK
jgi:hypothetical protein